MKKLSQRELIILVLTAGVIMSYAVYTFAIKPLREGSEDLADKVQVAESKLAKTKAMINRLPEVEAEYDRLALGLGRAASDGAEASSIVASLESAARDAGVHIANMQPQRASIKAPLKVFPVELIVEGEWSKIVKFLYFVQAEPNRFTVDELNLEKFSDASSSLRGRLLITRFRVMN